VAVKRRVVVVGVGSIGRRHARLLAERDDVAVELCEPNGDALAQAGLGGLPTYGCFAAALDSRPYAMVIATPVEFHCAQTLAAIGAGVHVLCEKPMSATLAEAEAMRDAAASSDAVVSFGFHLHFHPGLGRVKALVDSGALGEVLQVRHSTGSYITLVNSRSRYQEALEGALLMDYAHQPDAVHWLTGQRPLGVYMVGRQGGRMDYSSNPNYLTMVCDYASDLLATIELNYVQMPQRHEVEVIGDAAWVKYDFEDGVLQLGERQAQVIKRESVTVERDDVYRAEHQAFLEATEGVRPPSSPAEEAIVSMEVIDAALASWRSGARETLKPARAAGPSLGQEG